MSAKVSVIVPIYNVEKYLDKCINSLRNQTLNDIEIILVDDESPDNCPYICDKYAALDSRIKVIHKKNEGLGYARNSGLKISTGEYIVFVDSDDYIELDTLEKCYFIAKENDYDFVKYNLIRHEKKNNKIFKINSPLETGIYDENRIKSKILLPMIGILPNQEGDSYVNCSSCNFLYKSSIIKDNGILFVSEREYMSEDLIFNIQFLLNSKKAYVTDFYFYNYIANENSLTGVYRPERVEKEIFLNKQLSNLIANEIKLSTNEKNEIESRLSRTFIDRIRICIKAEIVRNDINLKTKRKNILNICKNEDVKSIIENYPISKLTFKYKISFTLIKYQLSTLIIIIYLIFKNF